MNATDTQNRPLHDALEPPQRQAAWALAGAAALSGIAMAPDNGISESLSKTIVWSAGMVLALLMVGWGVARSRTIRWSHWLWLPVALALYAVVSAAWTPWDLAVTEALRWAAFAGLVVAGLHTLDRAAGFRSVALGLCIAATLAAAWAAAQFWFDWMPMAQRADPASTFANRNHYAEFAVAAIPFTCWVWLQARTTAGASAAAAALGLQVLGVCMTGQRSSLLALVLITALLLALVLASRRAWATLQRTGPARWAILLLPLMLVAALGTLPTGNPNLIEEHTASGRGLTPLDRAGSRLSTLFSRDQLEDDSSIAGRMKVWRAGARMLADHPLRGVGAGAWNLEIPRYLDDDADNEGVWRAHNDYLQLSAEYGAVGMLFWLGLLALVGAASVRLARTLRGDAAAQPGIAATCVALASVAATLVTAVAGFPLQLAGTASVLALAACPLLAFAPRLLAARESTLPAWAARAVPAMAVVAMAVAAVALVQAARAEFHLRRGIGLATLAARPGQDAQFVAALKGKAIEDLRKGLELNPNQGEGLLQATTAISDLRDPKAMLPLLKMVQPLRPHAAELQCALSRVYGDLGSQAMAESTLAAVRAARPGASCLQMADLMASFRRGDFPAAVALGQRLLADPRTVASPVGGRLVLETTYRAALRVGNVPLAIELLDRRAALWPELAAESWMNAGRMLAQSAGAAVDPRALGYFQRALSASATADRARWRAMVPAPYQSQADTAPATR